MLLSGIRAPRLHQDFKTDPPTHPPTRIFKTPVLSITLLSTNSAPDPTTQTYLYHFSRFLNQICKLDPDFLLIQDQFNQITNPITILKPMKPKTKINIEPSPTWVDRSTNYMSKLRLLIKLTWFLPKHTLGASFLAMMLKPFVHIILEVLETLLPIIGY